MLIQINNEMRTNLNSTFFLIILPCFYPLFILFKKMPTKANPTAF